MQTNTTVLAAFLLRPVSLVRHGVVLSSIVAVAGCPGALPDAAAEGTHGGSSSTTGEDPDTTGATLHGTTGDMGTTEGGGTDAEPVCGNGIVEAGETCDDAGESATCDVDCTDVVCGDSMINAAAGEECEGDELGGGTCEGLGFDGGGLSCGGGCVYDVGGCADLPAAPELGLSFSQVKRFDFGWAAVVGAEYYQLWESASPGEDFVQVGGDIVGEAISIDVPLHFRFEASYVLQACNVAGCTESAAVEVAGSLAEAVGYFKASNTGAGDLFGSSVALSSDGNTLAVGAYFEDSHGIGNNQTNDEAENSGAVYVFVQDGTGTWAQQAYLKASNTGSGDRFGLPLALSDDGNTLAVSAHYEDSNAIGIGGDQANNDAADSGAVYVFVRDGVGNWSQQTYVKASNPGISDLFGISVALSGDGDTLAIGAMWENSDATGIDGDQIDDSLENAGAVYVFARDDMGLWSQQAYIKAYPTIDEWDEFGVRVALNGDGNTLAVAAYREDSNATGINGNPWNNTAPDAGAVYVFVRDGMGMWSQQAYVKASNTTEVSQAWFGNSIALSDDGNTLAVGAFREDGNATGIGGNEWDNAAPDAGAVYVFIRDRMGQWSQQAYVKASNTDSSDSFGWSVALSADGNTLAAGAHMEDSIAIGIDGDQVDDSSLDSGAAYVFVRDGAGLWIQHAYVKASNTNWNDQFGWSIALSSDGNTLAIGAPLEESTATGIGGNQDDNGAVNSGAVYLY